MQKKNLEIKMFQMSYKQYQQRRKSLNNSVINNYLILKEIGRGAFGSVYLAIDNIKHQKVAIKVINLKEIKEGKMSEQRRKKLFQFSITEPQLMYECASENIVKCYQVYESEDLKLIVMEYCADGTLFAQINLRKRIPQVEAILIIKQIFNGISEMHSKCIVHRDLKAQNIMQHYQLYKIADFGLSKCMSDEIEVKGTNLGTPGTMAPEVHQGKQYGLKADIWSVGIILFQMIFGKIPFIYNKLETLLKSNFISYNEYTASKQISDFLRGLLSIDSKNRLSWHAIQKQPIFFLVENRERIPSKIILDAKIVRPTGAAHLEENIGVNYSQIQNKFVKKRQQKYKLIFLTESHKQLKSLPKLQKNIEVAQWVRISNFQCLKIEFILNNIILVLERNVKLQKRKYCQMLYLIITRCWNTMSIIKQKAKQFDKKGIVNSFIKEIYKLQIKIKKYWEIFEKKVQDHENLFQQIFVDGLKNIFLYNFYKQKESFIVGIENIDYSKQQLIQYTNDKYLMPYLSKKEKIINEKTKRLKKLLFNYQRIWNAKLPQAKVFCFKEFIQKIINDR